MGVVPVVPAQAGTSPGKTSKDAAATPLILSLSKDSPSTGKNQQGGANVTPAQAGTRKTEYPLILSPSKDAENLAGKGWNGAA